MIGLINHAAQRKCDFAVVEIADGLQHLETATLLRSTKLHAMASGVVFAAYDSMGAKAGYHELRELGYSVLAISGQITRSPLAMREAAAASGCPIYTPFEIQAGALVPVMTGVTDHDSIAALRDRVRHTMENPNNFVVDFESHQRLPLRTQGIEGIYDFDYPDDLGETA